MTLDLKVIRERADAATPGPWICADADVGVEQGDETDTVASCDIDLCDADGRRNAAFIASTRADVPALCDEVERLRADAEDRDDHATTKRRLVEEHERLRRALAERDEARANEAVCCCGSLVSEHTERTEHGAQEHPQPCPNDRPLAEAKNEIDRLCAERDRFRDEAKQVVLGAIDDTLAKSVAREAEARRELGEAREAIRFLAMFYGSEPDWPKDNPAINAALVWPAENGGRP